MVKRIFDLSISLVVLTALSPFLFFIAVLVRIKLGSPVIFSQIRPGFDGKPFTMYKFRTMREAYDENGNPLPDKDRLTSLGLFLRSTSLDELPELVNVIKGEMSLVGPRPLLMRYLPFYTSRESLRHSVKPGITGWAQINGRNLLKWEERLAMDVWYVENRSFFFDLKILFLTVKKVLLRDGVVPEGGASLIALDEERARHPKGNIV